MNATSRPVRDATLVVVLVSLGFAAAPCEAPAAATPGRFVYTSGDAAALDSLTGRQWQRATAPTKLVLSAANAYCANLELAGKKDWRLPTVRELASIRDVFAAEPSIDLEVFPATKPDWYRTASSPYAVSFSNCMVFPRDDNDPAWVRCVRG